MEITEKQFIRALIDHFEKMALQWKGSQTGSLVLIEIEKIVDSLKELEKWSGSMDKNKVHLGHTFGPFGFKIE